MSWSVRCGGLIGRRHLHGTVIGLIQEADAAVRYSLGRVLMDDDRRGSLALPNATMGTSIYRYET